MYKYQAPGMTMLDDMSVWSGFCASNTSMLYAADFWAGNIVSANADGSGPGTVLVSGLYNPTSVRPGRGPGFDSGRKLFITEGGGLFPWITSRRVWELALDDRFAC
jgi:hypothetical protein